MKYNTVIFDFDGTIADSEIGITKGFQKGLAAFGVQEDLQVIRGLIGPPLSKTILTKYGFSPENGAAAMKICKDYQLGEGLDECCLFDGILPLLEGLRALGLRLAIATNKPANVARAQIGHFDLARRFDAIETNNDSQTRGTKADFVRMAMEGCGGTPATCLMVGDRKNDIAGGKENGMDTVGVLYGYGSRQEIEGCAPTYIAAQPLDILDIVKNA